MGGLGCFMMEGFYYSFRSSNRIRIGIRGYKVMRLLDGVWGGYNEKWGGGRGKINGN